MRDAEALTFVLSGLSKVTALPQLKLGWIAALGPAHLVRRGLERLEVIAIAYLSVSTPVQLALPEILAARGPIQAAILARVAENLAALDFAPSRRPTAPRGGSPPTPAGTLFFRCPAPAMRTDGSPRSSARKA